MMLIFLCSLNASAGTSGALDRTFSSDGRVTTAVASGSGADFGRDIAIPETVIQNFGNTGDKPTAGAFIP